MRAAGEERPVLNQRAEFIKQLSMVKFRKLLATMNRTANRDAP